MTPERTNRHARGQVNVDGRCSEIEHAQDLLARTVAEVDEVLGNTPEPTWDQVKKLKLVTREIKEGRLRLNWGAIRQASRDVKVGDQLQLQDRGSVEVLSLTLTKRERWRVEMMRR